MRSKITCVILKQKFFILFKINSSCKLFIENYDKRIKLQKSNITDMQKWYNWF